MANAIRDSIDAETLAALDKMADGHMVPVIEYGDAWECETEHGETFFVPADLVPVGDYFAWPEDLDTDTFRQYMPEGCSGKVASATVRRNVFLARMSAPGYMDCTDWECHATAQEAADSLVSNYGD